MYEPFFGLERRPFSATPDPDCFFAPESVQGVLDALAINTERGQGIGLLTAPAGLGKTLICQRLVREIGQGFQAVVLGNAGFPSRRSLLQAILFELGVEYSRKDEAELRLDLRKYLQQLRPAREALVLIVDEAHLLADELLEEIRTLTDIAQLGRPLVRVILCGQQELEERLTSRSFDALNQRISSHLWLEPFTLAESTEYLRYRIEQSGGRSETIMTAEVLRLIARASDGNPRCLNQLADHCLLLAYAADERPVAAQTVHDALDDLKQLPLQWNDISQPAFRSAGVESESAADNSASFDSSTSSFVEEAEPEFSSDETCPACSEESVGMRVDEPATAGGTEPVLSRAVTEGISFEITAAGCRTVPQATCADARPASIAKVVIAENVVREPVRSTMESSVHNRSRSFETELVDDPWISRLEPQQAEVIWSLASRWGASSHEEPVDESTSATEISEEASPVINRSSLEAGDGCEPEKSRGELSNTADSPNTAVFEFGSSDRETFLSPDSFRTEDERDDPQQADVPASAESLTPVRAIDADDCLNTIIPLLGELDELPESADEPLTAHRSSREVAAELLQNLHSSSMHIEDEIGEMVLDLCLDTQAAVRETARLLDQPSETSDSECVDSDDALLPDLFDIVQPEAEWNELSHRLDQGPSTGASEQPVEDRAASESQRRFCRLFTALRRRNRIAG